MLHSMFTHDWNSIIKYKTQNAKIRNIQFRLPTTIDIAIGLHSNIFPYFVHLKLNSGHTLTVAVKSYLSQATYQNFRVPCVTKCFATEVPENPLRLLQFQHFRISTMTRAFHCDAKCSNLD